MAVSEPMSNYADWMHFYQQNLSRQPQNTPSFSGSVSETVTAAAASGRATEVAQSNLSPSYSNLNMDGGRASRPPRRRPRASRRTPVVLINTDTSNFRAMVQQFTGGPSSSFASRTERSNGVNFGVGLGTQQSMNPSTAMAPSGFQIQSQRQQQYPNQQQHNFYSLNNNTQCDAAAFLHKFMPNTEVEASSGFVKNGGSAHVQPSEGSGGRGGFHQ